MLTGKDFFRNSQQDEPQKTLWDFYKRTGVFPDKNSPDILFGKSNYMMKHGQKEKERRVLMGYRWTDSPRQRNEPEEEIVFSWEVQDDEKEHEPEGSRNEARKSGASF